MSRPTRRIGAALRAPLALVLALAALVLVLRSLTGGAGDPSTAPRPDPGALPATGAEELALGGRSALPGPEAASRGDARTLLRAHFGSDAPAVEALLAERGVDLAGYPAPPTFAELQPHLAQWFTFGPAERTERLRVAVEWPEDGAEQRWLERRFGPLRPLGLAELEAIDALAATYEPELRERAGLYLDALERGFQHELAVGRLEASPFLRWPPEGSTAPSEAARRPVVTLLRSGHGWFTSVGLDPADHPEPFALRQELHGLVDRRDADLRQALVPYER